MFLWDQSKQRNGSKGQVGAEELEVLVVILERPQQLVYPPAGRKICRTTEQSLQESRNADLRGALRRCAFALHRR